MHKSQSLLNTSNFEASNWATRKVKPVIHQFRQHYDRVQFLYLFPRKHVARSQNTDVKLGDGGSKLEVSHFFFFFLSSQSTCRLPQPQTTC